MYKKPGANWTKHIDFMLLDVLCLCVSFYLALAVRFQNEPELANASRGVLWAYVLVMLISEFALSNFNDVLKRGNLMELISVLELTLCTVILVSLYVFASHTATDVSRIHIFLTALFFAILDWLLRILWKLQVRANLKRTKIKRSERRTVYVVAEQKHFSRFIEEIKNDIYIDYKICGTTIIDCSFGRNEYQGIPVIENLEDAARFICREWVDEVFVFMPGSSDAVSNFLDHCRSMGVTVHYAFNIKEVDNNKQFIESIGEYSVVTTAFNYMSTRQIVFKRAADIIFSLLGCIAAVLIGIVVGPIIYFNSPGSIIFRQQRVGKNGKLFNVFKFRSMYLDAEERKKDYVAQNRVADGMMFKLDFDPRIIGNRILPDGKKKTGIGEFIRRTSLDEFPQFFNVLLGDMSIVGTRPPTVDEWEKYEYHHRARLAVKPGITGMWQVSGRSEITDFEEVVRLDTEYISKYRIALDIKIFFKTIVVLLKRKGAM